MKKLKIIFSLVSWLVTLVLVATIVLVAFPVLKISGEGRFFVVQTGSMEPALKAGSVVLVQKKDTYSKGEIITFRSGGGEKETTTHRISQSRLEKGEEVFATRGDANTGEDREEVKIQNILGRVVYIIPFLGYTVSLARTQLGLIILVIIPGAIIVHSEFLSLKKEISNLINNKKELNLSQNEY